MNWWLDIKLGVRMLIKYPGLALVGVFGIAVAVAIAAGGFSLVYSNFLVSSLPLPEGSRLVSIEMKDPAANKPERRIWHDYRMWREELKSISELGAFRTITPNLIVGGAQPESIRVASMTASGFILARVRPLIGRYLMENDEHDGAPLVVVIGENLWRTRFAADPAIVGRTVQLGSSLHTVVGVMPAGFAFPVNHRLWVPLRLGVAQPEPLTGPDIMVFGRLAPGATFESAQAELATLVRHTATSVRDGGAQLRPQVLPYANPFLGLHDTGDAAGLFMMNLLVAMILVLVCGNVAILVYTRTAMRHAEIALRTALGATRGRIVAQLFFEAFVLSAVGAMVGVGFAVLALRQIAAATQHIAAELPFWISFDLSPGAVAYAGALSVLAAAIVGIVPALKATSGKVQKSLRVIGAGGSGMRLGTTWTALVVMQVCFAVALLPAALSTGWENLRAEIDDPGFPAAELLTTQLGLDSVQRTDATKESTREFSRIYANRHGELIRRLEAEPGILRTTFASALPGDEPGAVIEAESIHATTRGAPPTAGGSAVRFNRVDVKFFQVCDVPILAGRDFEQGDVTSAGASSEDRREGGVVVVNQSLAQQIFAGNALGRRIRYVVRNASNGQSGGWYEIVGIVKDFPTGVSPGMNSAQLRVYHPATAGQVQPVNMMLHVSGPSTFARRLSELATAVDPDLQLRNVMSMEEALHKEQWIRRMEAAVLGALSLSVLLLSSAGIYALMSFTVLQRRKEIGIRMALGAGGTRIVASIFSRALGQLAAGAALGAALALGIEKAAGNTLIRGNATVVLSTVALTLMAVGVLAALGPARRCLRIEPTDALRQ